MVVSKGEGLSTVNTVVTVKMMASNGEEGLQKAANDGVDVFSNRRKFGAVEEVATVDVAAITGQSSFSVATAPVWGISQRVKILEKGEGIVLFVGKLPFAVKRRVVMGYGMAWLLMTRRVDTMALWRAKITSAAAKNMVYLLNMRGCRWRRCWLMTLC